MDWEKTTTLVVYDEAFDAYLAHPIWSRFRNIISMGVNEVQADKVVVSEKWYSLDGRALDKPEIGKVNIRISTYSDGTQTKSKHFVAR